MNKILKDVLNIISHCMLITFFITNLLILFTNYGHLFEVIVAETICIPLLYIIIFIAYKVGEKE